MAIGGSDIVNRSQSIAAQINEKLSSCGSLILLGNPGVKARLATFSFVLSHPDSGLYIHHNFVCALFNDLFGIQARAFSALSSKQGRHIFQVQDSSSSPAAPRAIINPGYVTVDIPWFFTDEEVSVLSGSMRWSAAFKKTIYTLVCQGKGTPDSVLRYLIFPTFLMHEDSPLLSMKTIPSEVSSFPNGATFAVVYVCYVSSINRNTTILNEKGKRGFG